MNGDRYSGNYNNDKKEGKGTMYYADGSKLVGEWVDGLMEGKATYESKDGKTEIR